MDSTAQDLAGLGAASAHCAELSGGSIERRYCAAVANHPQTVGKWRARFTHQRLDGFLDEPRPGAPRTIGDAVVEKVIAKTLHEAARGHALEQSLDG